MGKVTRILRRIERGRQNMVRSIDKFNDRDDLPYTFNMDEEEKKKPKFRHKY
jgi:hypothetical protein